MFEFIIKYKIKKLCKKKRIPVYRGINELQKFLVLFETNDYEYVDQFMERIKGMKKEIKGCGYRPKDNEVVYSKSSSFIIVPKLDTDKYGIPSEKLLKSLSSEKYDAIIDLTINENYTLEYILLYLDSSLKIGLKKNNLPLYDIAICGLSDSKGNNLSAANRLGELIFSSLNVLTAGR